VKHKLPPNADQVFFIEELFEIERTDASIDGICIGLHCELLPYLDSLELRALRKGPVGCIGPGARCLFYTKVLFSDVPYSYVTDLTFPICLRIAGRPCRLERPARLPP